MCQRLKTLIDNITETKFKTSKTNKTKDKDKEKEE